MSGHYVFGVHRTVSCGIKGSDVPSVESWPVLPDLDGWGSRVTNPGTLGSPALSGASSPNIPEFVGWLGFESHQSGDPREPCPIRG